MPGRLRGERAVCQLRRWSPVLPALVALALPACTDTELTAHVVLLDPASGDELEQRSLASPSSGWVRVAKRPDEGDVLAWGTSGKMDFRSDGWTRIDLDMTEFDVAPVEGQALPEVFAFADGRAFLWSPQSESFEANLVSAAQPGSVVATDWNGDGTIDVAAAGGTAGTWFHPRVDDGLDEAVILDEEWGADLRLTVGDFDGDGQLDLVRTLDEYVHVGFGVGDGSVEETIGAPYPYMNVMTVALADVTDDGNLDVVLGGEESIQVLENGGDRTLSAGAAIEDMVHPIELVDVDDDGDVDIIGQPPHELGEHSTELLLIENRGGQLGAPRPFADLGQNVSDLAFGTDADGTRWLAVSTWSFERVAGSPERR